MPPAGSPIGPHCWAARWSGGPGPGPRFGRHPSSGSGSETADPGRQAIVPWRTLCWGVRLSLD